jgi:hypothetical protein
MDNLDLQIFFGDLFEKCKNVEQVDRLYNRLIDNLEICKEERLDVLGE